MPIMGPMAPAFDRGNAPTLAGARTASPAADPQQAQMRAQQAAAMKLKMAAGARPDQFGGGAPPPRPMPPPGGGLQAAGFGQRPPPAQYAQRFPGAQAPRQPQFPGGAFGMKPVPQAPGMTKQPQFRGSMQQSFGGRPTPYVGGSQR